MPVYYVTLTIATAFLYISVYASFLNSNHCTISMFTLPNSEEKVLSNDISLET